MGIEHNKKPAAAVAAEGSITTALLVLTLLNRDPSKAWSTYDLGLWINDNHTPPRPLSVIIKNLAGDEYVEKAAAAGKRAGLWAITRRGRESLQNRAAEHAAARRWLDKNPNFSVEEICVLISLRSTGPQTPSRIAAQSQLSLSPARTALKRLTLRGLTVHTEEFNKGFDLTSAGRTAANREYAIFQNLSLAA